MSAVQPVAILNAVFCVVCNFCSVVFDVIGDQMVLPYSILGNLMVLKVVAIVSFDFPHFVVVRVLSILMVLSAFSLVCLVCSTKFNFGSKVMPRIFGCLLVGICMLFIVSDRVELYSAGSGVNSVDVDLSGFSFRSLSRVQLYSCIVAVHVGMRCEGSYVVCICF